MSGELSLKIIEDSVHPLEAALSKALSSIIAPYPGTIAKLAASKKIMCATDFSDTFIKNGRNYTTAAVLLAPEHEWPKWNLSYRRQFRTRDRFGGQSVSYKGTRQRADHLERLASFALAAGSLEGLLVTASFPRKTHYIFTKKTDCTTHPKLTQFNAWEPLVFEDLVRFASILTVCLCPFIRDGQFVGWLCDEDKIVADEARQVSASSFVEDWVSSHLAVPVQIGLTLPTNPLLDRVAAEDFLAIPDIAAGGIGETISYYATQIGPDRLGEWIPSPDGQKKKADVIALWFGNKNLRLVRAAVSLEPDLGKAIAHEFGHTARIE